MSKCFYCNPFKYLETYSANNQQGYKMCCGMCCGANQRIFYNEDNSFNNIFITYNYYNINIYIYDKELLTYLNKIVLSKKNIPIYKRIFNKLCVNTNFSNPEDHLNYLLKISTLN